MTMAEKEYIEREALITEIASHKMTEVVPNCYEPSIKLAVCKQGQAIKTIIKSQPAADVVEVRHGEWVEQLDGTHYCSECGHDATYTFDGTEVCGIGCPFCGAKMDGKVVSK